MTTAVAQQVMDKFQKILEHVIRASFACVWIRTQEEERTIKIINKVVKKLEGEAAKLFIWDSNGEIAQYIEDEDKETAIKKKCEDPIEVFPAFASNSFKEKSAMVVLDFNFFLGDSAQLIRSIKNSLNILKRDGKIIIFVGPRLKLPEEIEKDVNVINFPLPGREELKNYLDFVIESAQREAGAGQVPEDTKEKLVDAALGLTSQEAEDAFSLAVVKNIKLDGDSIKTVLDQKCQILRKEGTLEYINPSEKMEDIGGLDSLKDWLIKRKQAFGKRSREIGLPPPKGILLVGISGCGKSLTAKAAASNWELGIYRLDVGKIFTKLMGESEGNARKVIEVAETVAPCILWIDEIEKGMAGSRSSGELDSGVTARVLSTILTWMQEKTAPVFIVATANDITKLPPELLRKGRFDEIFFVDLPNNEERTEIVNIQLRKWLKQYPVKHQVDVPSIVSASDTYTGAEIEQAILSGLYECAAEGERALTTEDVVKALKSFVPLAKTMNEEIEFLRSWGSTRARHASGKVKSSFTQKPRSSLADAGFLRKVNPVGKINKDVE